MMTRVYRTHDRRTLDVVASIATTYTLARNTRRKARTVARMLQTRRRAHFIGELTAAIVSVAIMAGVVIVAIA